MRIKHWILPLFALLVFGSRSYAQQKTMVPDNAPVQLFPSYKIQYGEELNADRVLQEGISLLPGNMQAKDFSLVSERHSPEGAHYLYSFAPEGISYLDRYIKVFVDKQHVIRQLLYDLSDIDLPQSGSFADEVALKKSFEGYSHIGEMNKLWVWAAPFWQAAVEVVLIEDLAAYAEKRYFDGSLNEIHREDFAWRFKGKDTTIYALVFNPDPLTSAQVPYGDGYSDFNDADTSTLNNERISKPIRIDFVNDSFILQDSIFHFEELEKPYTDEPKGLTPNFNFTRANDDFEYVNVYYHLQTWARRVHDLGYNLPNTSIQVDPHASNGADVSGFTPAYGELALVFGDGGIDDGEDADVIVHEFGHVLSYTASPATTNGLERTSMEEGTCDYFAMSYSRQISSYGWEKTFNWDGNVTWKGRPANTDKAFPGDFSNNKYNNAEVWVAGLVEVYDSLGPDITDRIVLCALYNQVSNMTFVQMVENCRQCDSIQNGGANSMIIYHAMNRRGMAHPMGFKKGQETNWKLLNSEGFAFRGEIMILDFAGNPIGGKVEVFDLQGKLVRQSMFRENTQVNVSAEGIEKGLYLLRVTSDTNLTYTFLIARH